MSLFYTFQVVTAFLTLPVIDRKFKNHHIVKLKNREIGVDLHSTNHLIVLAS